MILCTLPKTRATQQILQGRKIDKAWKNVCTFIDTCTTAQSGQPASINLIGYSAKIDERNEEIAAAIIKNAQRIFGEGQTTPIAQTKTEWSLGNERLMTAVDYLIQGQP